MDLKITEIISRSEQGMTRPFLCRAENGELYYVKGRYAGIRSLSSEWVAGTLGRLMGLPIPDFRIATVPSNLVNDSSRTDAQDLGTGPVFASQLVEDAQELAFADIQSIEALLKQEVLLFDWWVQNEDRILTEFGGNPNLLRTAGGDLRVFDLNLAFDESFNAGEFWKWHVFGSVTENWSEGFKGEMTRRMRSAVAELPAIYGELPQEWQQTGGLDLQFVQRLLNRFEASPDDFWAIRK